MRKFSSNLAFVDLLFNLLVGFVSLFIIAFLLIQPPTNPGKIDPPIEFLVTIDWDKNSTSDVDLWVKGPSGRPVGFKHKDIGYLVLNRDDTGNGNDFVIINGKRTDIKENYEVVEGRAIAPGEYIVNLHYFRQANEEGVVDVRVRLQDIRPFLNVHEVIVRLPTNKAERTAFSFIVDETGKITSVNTETSAKIVPSDVVVAEDF